MPLKKSVRTIVRRATTPIATFREIGDRRTHVYFLHIGKTAGTQIIHVIEQVNSGNAAYFLIAPGHGRKLLTLPEAAPYFFSIRRPEGRFRSAFYSRKRKGLPRHPVEWPPDEGPRSPGSSMPTTSPRRCFPRARTATMHSSR